MFRISTKGDYGLLLMTTLAERWVTDDPPFISLKLVASGKKLSLSYLSQIIIPLKNAGLVESKEGINGGYRLAKEPQKISLFEILEVLEGEIAPVKCCSGGSVPCSCEEVCGVKSTWFEATDMLRKYFHGRKLSDLVSKKTDEFIQFSS